jgi:hypothetical protein
VSLTHWQKTVLNLFIEIGRIEPLIEKRLSTTRPAGLDENQFVLLSHMVGVGESGETRASLKWALQGTGCDIDIEVARAVDHGWMVAPGDRVAITAFGQQTHENAVISLSPEFEQLLRDMPIEELESARKTLCEIRRTLDNLPDR